MLLSTAGISISSAEEPPRFSEDIDSTCSTPFVSAPSSPGHAPSGYFFSAPASPMHFILSSEKTKASSTDHDPVFLSSGSGSFEFEFSSRFSPNGSGGIASMTSADELFFNGQIRPMKLSSHLQRPQEVVAPFGDLFAEEATSARGRDLRMRGTKYSHRKARSMSPLRAAAQYEWQGLGTIAADQENEAKENESSETTPSCSASSSRSSSSGRNSKKWIFLKDLLNRSKSEEEPTTRRGSGRRSHSLPPRRRKRRPSYLPHPPVTRRKEKPRRRKEGKLRLPENQRTACGNDGFHHRLTSCITQQTELKRRR
ncbi:UNVERIFIED_CONTAM: hypothetical protein Slati_0601700 [Sesamum latifolium]|uniref:Uncharacterized protein n=1 Tax=Sesamum latifolium TaxID=2727402 RepID=A0AAW2Y1X9_9LAMI